MIHSELVCQRLNILNFSDSVIHSELLSNIFGNGNVFGNGLQAGSVPVSMTLVQC